MALRLPRLPVGWKDLPQLFERYWDEAMKKIEDNDNRQELVINNLRRITSHTNPTTIMIANPTKVTISDHIRVYGDGSTLNITGGEKTGLNPDTLYFFYYDDTTLSNPSPAILVTTNSAEAQSVAAVGRHFLGAITTPSSGSSENRPGGGVYPIGSNVGGEI